MSLGDSCPDRGVAFAAITQGRGWDWVFGGGTAEYTAVYPNPVPPGFVGNGFNIVDAVRTGNEGAVAELVSGADVTLDDFECPVVENFTVNDGVVFSIDPRSFPGCATRMAWTWQRSPPTTCSTAARRASSRRSSSSRRRASRPPAPGRISRAPSSRHSSTSTG